MTSRTRGPKPDYSRMSLAELEDARNWIDEERFPERVAEIEKWIVTRVREGDRSSAHDDIPDRSHELVSAFLPSSHLVKALADVIAAVSGYIAASAFISPEFPGYRQAKIIALLGVAGLLIHAAYNFYLWVKPLGGAGPRKLDGVQSPSLRNKSDTESHR